MKLEFLLFGAIAAFSALAQEAVTEENLCDFRPARFASWMPAERFSVPLDTQYGFRVKTDAKNPVVHKSLCGYWFPAYTASEKVRVTFRYRGSFWGRTP